MDITILLRGIVIGFSIAAPVGPIGVLCIRRTLGDGRAIGFTSGMGAATADALYGCSAALGLTLVSDFLIGQKFWLSLIGGLFLITLGVKTFASRPPIPSADSSRARTRRRLRLNLVPHPDQPRDDSFVPRHLRRAGYRQRNTQLLRRLRSCRRRVHRSPCGGLL